MTAPLPRPDPLDVQTLGELDRRRRPASIHRLVADPAYREGYDAGVEDGLAQRSASAAVLVALILGAVLALGLEHVLLPLLAELVR